MQKTTGHIIKGDKVQLNGAYRIKTAEPVTKPATQAPNPSVPTPAQAKIVDTNNECALIEVTCSCGKKIPIKCIYMNQPS